MEPLRVLLADPPLFTAPYDAALSAGLRCNNIAPSWVVRALRVGEGADLEPDETLPFFYPLSDGPRRRPNGRGRLLKGMEHWQGMSRLARLVESRNFDAVHFQWSVLPSVDRLFLQRLRRTCPVVLTVHDTTPFNGKSVNFLQKQGFDRLLGNMDALIVHTVGGRELLQAQGIPPEKIAVVPHGPLALKAPPAAAEAARTRWRIVMFGRLQSYKGVDILIEALGLMDQVQRTQIEVVIAGEPMIPMDAIRARTAELGLDGVVDFRLRRLDDDEMAVLLHGADCFVFPYLAIEASGVLFLVADLRKWIVASDLGAFRETIGNAGGAGALVAPADPAALADALIASVGRQPASAITESRIGWPEIGALTRQVYETAIFRHQRIRAAA